MGQKIKIKMAALSSAIKSGALDGASLGDSIKLNKKRLQRRQNPDGGDRAPVRHPTYKDLSVDAGAAPGPLADGVEPAEGADSARPGVTFGSAEMVHSPTAKLGSKLASATDSMRIHRKRMSRTHGTVGDALQPPAAGSSGGGSRLASTSDADASAAAAASVASALPPHVQDLASRLSSATDSMKLNKKRLG